MNINNILESEPHLQKLNDNISRYTNFKSFEDLVDPKHNYRPIFRFSRKISHLELEALYVIAKYYDEYMKQIGDPRRIYYFNTKEK